MLVCAVLVPPLPQSLRPMSPPVHRRVSAQVVYGKARGTEEDCEQLGTLRRLPSLAGEDGTAEEPPSDSSNEHHVPPVLVTLSLFSTLSQSLCCPSPRVPAVSSFAGGAATASDSPWFLWDKHALKACTYGEHDRN